MIKEDYVSFAVAKLLKEKGFAETLNTIGTYNDKGEFCLYKHEKGYNHNHLTSWYSAPTLQMACKWLREVHNIDISIFPTIETDMIVREDYNYAIYKNKTVVYQSCSISHEEAVEAALKYSLKNLI